MENEQQRKSQIGHIASFLIRVGKHNGTWQGSISWTDKGVTKNFRSTLELIKLMDSAVATDTPGNSPEEMEEAI